MKAYTFPRALAFIVDIIIISIITSLLFLPFPQHNNYSKLTNQVQEYATTYSSGQITVNQYLAQVNDISYDVSYQHVPYTIIYIVMTIGYFVVFQYKNNGQTLGKKIFCVKVVSNSDDDLTINNYLIRSLICNSLLINILDLFLIVFINRNNYGYVSTIFSFIQLIVTISSIFMIIYRKDGRGIHDIVANTKVVMADKKEN